MPLHTNPPSGNRRHLTSANAGAFIQQSAGAVVSGARIAPGDCLLPVVRGANLNTTGREQSRDLSTSYAPVVSGSARTFLENQPKVRAATRLHGATI